MINKSWIFDKPGLSRMGLEPLIIILGDTAVSDRDNWATSNGSSECGVDASIPLCRKSSRSLPEQ